MSQEEDIRARWISEHAAGALEAVLNSITADAPKLASPCNRFADTVFVSELTAVIKLHLDESELIEWAAKITEGDIPTFEDYFESESGPDEDYDRGESWRLNQ